MTRRDKNKLCKKLACAVLILAHILTVGPQGEVLAALSSSANYKLNLGFTNEGSAQRDSASAIIKQDTLAEAASGKTESISYILETGFIYTLQSNPPVFTPSIPNFFWEENQSLPDAFDLDNYFSSPDGLSLSYSVIGNNQITVDIDPETHLVSFFSPPAWCGTEEVIFTATDTEENSTPSNEVTLQVIGEDQDNPPILDYIPDVYVFETELVQITPQAFDPDGDEITYTFTPPLDENGEWLTTSEDAGEYIATVTATDSTGLSDSQDVKITVKNANRLPILEPIADIEANEADVVVITPQATDPDGDALTFYYSFPFNSQGIWQTDYDDAGTHPVTVTVYDGADTVSQELTVTIHNINRAPQLNLSLSDYTVDFNQTIYIQLQAIDPDGDALDFTIQKDGQEIDSGALDGIYTTTTSFSSAEGGDRTISATVTDPDGLFAQETKGVDVVDPSVDPDTVNPVMGDFNADGLSDLGFHNYITGEWGICLSDQGIFRNATGWLENFGGSQEWYPLGGDFNGDGRGDIGIYHLSNGQLNIALSTGSQFDNSGTWFTFPDASYDWQPFTGNFNADRYTDFGLYNRATGEVRVALGNGSGFIAFSTWLNSFGGDGWTAFSADFNADSLSDLCIFKKSAGEFRVAFSNTEGFVDASSWINGFATDKTPLVADFNNDGLTDIGFWDEETFSWQYALSTGKDFQDKGVWLEDFGTASDESAHTGDFDGDGVTDAACFDRDAQGIERWSVELSSRKLADLLVEIDNGIGGKTQVCYGYAAQYQNEFLPFPVYVAKSTTVTDTLPSPDDPQTYESYTQNFSYFGGYYDAEEREFRGFEKVTATDPETGNYTETCFYQGKPGQDAALKGKIRQLVAYDGNGNLITKAENTWEVRKAGDSDNFLGFPYLQQATTTVWEQNGTSLSTENSFTYDNLGNITETINEGDIASDGDEKISQLTYTPAYQGGFNRPQESALKDALDNLLSQQLFTYDEKGNLTEELVWLYNPLTETDEHIPTTYGYDAFGNTTSVTNAKNLTVTTEYETVFYTFPETVTNALAQTVEYSYEEKFGVVCAVTDVNGQTTSTEYDTLGRVTCTKNTSGEVVTAYSYPDFNTKITTQLNLTTTEYLDGLGRKYKTVSSGEDGPAQRNVLSEVFYNERGLKDKESLAHYEGEEAISYIKYEEYDGRGRPTITISDFPGTAKDAQTQINYINPLYTETIDPLGHKKGLLKDVFGNNIRITEFTQGGVYHTYYEYDLQGNLTKTTDAQGNISQIWYDSLGRKLQMDDPDMGLWHYEYDDLGNLTKQTDARGRVIEFEYDELNRLGTKSLRKTEGGEAILITYNYDDQSHPNRIGRLSRVEDQNCVTEFFYDTEGREVKTIKSLRGAAGDEAISYTVERSYDILDRLTSLKYPDGEVVNYSYDIHSGLLEKVEGSSVYAENITYNAQGQMLNIQYGNQTETAYSYAQDLRLSRILTYDPAGSRVQDLSYTFDHNGNLISLFDDLTNNERTYTYDDLDRLTSAWNIPDNSTWGYGDFSYHYDAIGNMTYKSDVGVMEYGQQAGPHAVTSLRGAAGDEAIPITYDENGNMTTGKDKVMGYDIENRLSIVIIPSSTSSTTQFFYDGDGGRVKKQNLDTGQYTVYIGSIYEVDSEGLPTKHVFAGTNRICSLKSDDSELYYHQDHLGSSNIITDQTGTELVSYEYQPYGKVSQQTGTDVANHKFTGKELDSSTGLYYYGARYYDPEIGRFITADPTIQHLYDPQDFNRYSYCRNNPINYVDPTGYGWFSNFFKSIGNFFKNNWKGIVAGIAGAAIGAWIAAPLISSMGASFAATGTGISFTEGFLIGGVELGIPTFTGRLAGGMASGQKFSQALKGAGIAAGAAFVAGGMIEGSYAAGWQNKFHFSDTRIAEINEIKRSYAAGDYARAHYLENIVAQKGISASTAKTLGWPAPKRTLFDKIFRWEGKGEPYTEGWRWEFAGTVESDAFVVARGGLWGVTEKWKNYLSYKGWGRYVWDMNDTTRIWKYYGTQNTTTKAGVYGYTYELIYPDKVSPWE